MYELNLVYFKELTMYILAGKKKLAEVRANDLKAAQEKAQRTQLPEDAQAARDLADLCDRFEKKLYDLELTRNVSIQMGPQIRLIQSNDTMMAEKIQTTIVNTIPLWKNQMVLALGIAHSQQAMQAERAVTDAPGFGERRRGLDLHAVLAEGMRCMTCGAKARIAYNDDCMTCFTCELRCPAEAINVHPFKEPLPRTLEIHCED